MLVMYLFQTDCRSNNMEPFFNIPLNISNSLEQSLDDYVAEQVLSGDNMYYADPYGPQVAKKSVKFLTLPPIIMVQLKRFQFNYYTGKNEKIMHKFKYPAVVDFSRWQINSQNLGPCNYELYAVLVHQGIKAQSGHYYAFVKINQCWYRFNDQQVSLASDLQVFDYNYGGEIDVVQFDARQFKVYNRKTVSNSTAYMLVYVNRDKKQQLLNSQPIYPQWLKQHQIIKQQERQQLKNRKNYYHGVIAFYWQANFKDSIADYLGFVPKNIGGYEGQIIGKLIKNDKIEEWVKPYNEKGLGVYLYLTTTQKTEYETLINLQHRKCNFQQIVRDPNCPIVLIFLPIVCNLDDYLYIIKLTTPIIKFRQQGQPEYQIQIRFNHFLSINRNSRNSQLLAKLKQMYDEEGYDMKYYYQQKKQISQVSDNNYLVKGPPLQRNILGIIIVQKIEKNLRQQFPNPTLKWYNDLKNFVQILFKSEDGKHSFEAIMDQNKSTQSLRQYIFDLVKNNQGCFSPENIVLKAKPKKTAKNYMQIIGAKTIRDLIKNCDKQNIIVFSFSNLKVEQRVSQVQIKFVYRFKDFSFSDIFHVILDRNSQNKSINIYQKIAEHQQVQKYKKAQGMNGIRIFLFSKDRNVINDIVSETGHVHGKGQIAQVLQKQKGSQLVVQSVLKQKIQENMCPILLHHRSQNEQRIGIPRHLQFDRSCKLVQIHDQILNLIKDDVYEWEDKKIKINPMKVSLYAYTKDYNKGIYLYDHQSLIQNQIQEQKQKMKQKQTKMMKQQQENLQKSKQKKLQIGSTPQQKLAENQINNINFMPNHNSKIEEQQQQLQEKSSSKSKVEQNNVESSEQQKNKNNQNNNQIPNGEDIQVQNGSIKNNGTKNSKCEQKLKPWQQTIESVFSKAKYIKIAVHHLYLTKAQSTMKINV